MIEAFISSKGKSLIMAGVAQLQFMPIVALTVDSAVKRHLRSIDRGIRVQEERPPSIRIKEIEKSSFPL
jgi:hypothetical protein